MFDLKDILKKVKVDEKVERKATLIQAVESHPTWTLKDKTEAVCNIALTRYQLHWIRCRIRVHLRSYEALEFSEMKTVLNEVLVLMENEWEKSNEHL